MVGLAVEVVVISVAEVVMSHLDEVGVEKVEVILEVVGTETEVSGVQATGVIFEAVEEILGRVIPLEVEVVIVLFSVENENLMVVSVQLQQLKSLNLKVNLD